ncbi:MAG TPA: hypothetical protein ENH34_04495 [Phycisphaerales bacterium]|nr:hypothetical protein [Phycisphaerales bacterium]
MKIKKLLFYLLATLLGGCIPVMSLHPLYTDKDLIFEEKLLGTWVDDSNDTTWEFQLVANEPDNASEFKHPDKPEKAYKLIFSNNDGKTKGLFFTHLVKLENKFFMDVFPSQLPYMPRDPNEGWIYNMYFLVPVHTFIKIDSIEPQLKMRFTDDDEMEKLLKEDPNAVKYELVNDRLILTASTKELQAFVLKYADDSRVFTDEIVLNRKKTQDPNDPNNTDPNEG